MVAQGTDTVQVSACGRSIQIDLSVGRTISNMQKGLQKELSMQGQTFEIFDICGTNLSTDGDLEEALKENRTPFAASLSEASIHYIENRREEMAQMQWKLMRDQLSGVTEKIMQLGRRTGELQEQIERHEKEVAGSCDRLRHEMVGLVENSKDITKQSLLQLVERVDAVSHLIHSERNIREASKLGIERQIQGVRDIVESDRSARRTEAAATVSLIEEGRQALMEEARTREAFEDRHAYDVDRLSERIEALTRSSAEKSQDLMDQLKQVAFQANSAVQDNNRMTFQVRAGAESAQIEAGSRLLKLEDRLASMEARIMEEKSRQAQNFDRLNEKNEKIVQSIEQVRISERGKGPLIQTVMGRVDELEEVIKATEVETREAVVRERLQRQQELRGTQQTLLAQSAKLYTEMEDKVSTRLERESAVRASVCKQIMDDVSAALPEEQSVNGGSFVGTGGVVYRQSQVVSRRSRQSQSPSPTIVQAQPIVYAQPPSMVSRSVSSPAFPQRMGTSVQSASSAGGDGPGSLNAPAQPSPSPLSPSNSNLSMLSVCHGRRSSMAGCE